MDAVGASSISVTFTGSVHPHRAAMSIACWQLTTASFPWRGVLHQIGTALLEPLGASHYQWLNYTEYNCLGPLSQVVTNSGVQSMLWVPPEIATWGLSWLRRLPWLLPPPYPTPSLALRALSLLNLCTWLPCAHDCRLGF